MAEKDSDLRKIEELIELMKKNDLAEIEISHGEDKYHLKRSQPTPQVVHQMPFAGGVPAADAGHVHKVQSAGTTEEADHNLIDITAPIVGTFYAQPSPDAEPFVDAGSHIEPDSVVCIIEAMKVMNEIKAETTGTIAEICVSSGEAVEYGQVLFRVKPD